MVEGIRPTQKQPTCIIQYNSNFDSVLDNSIEFIDIDLSRNNLSLWLLANMSIIRTKKRHIVEIEDEANEISKVKATQEKRIPVK